MTDTATRYTLNILALREIFKGEGEPARATATLHIETREDGGVCIWAPGTGLVLSSDDRDAVFADLGPALRVVLGFK